MPDWTLAAAGHWERTYGRPAVLYLAQTVRPAEATMIRASQRHGRAHDITLLIRGPDGRLAVIAKHSYPPGAFRAPSGGLRPDEPLEVGALREAYEETGLAIQLGRYLLRVLALFTTERDTIPWLTHVFTARVVGGQLASHDPQEIRDVAWVTLADLQGPIRRALLADGRPLFRYRVRLTDETVACLARNCPG